MNIRFKVRDMQAVKDYIKTVPYGAVKVALRAFTEYIVGDDRHGLKHPDPYKFVSRKSAYGSTGAVFESGKPVPDGYFSAKQFRYVAYITKGFTENIGDNRKSPTSPTLFVMTPTNNGYGYNISSDTAGAFFARGDNSQARQLSLVGWRAVSKVIADNFEGAVRHMVAEVKRHLGQ